MSRAVHFLAKPEAQMDTTLFQHSSSALSIVCLPFSAVPLCAVGVHLAAVLKPAPQTAQGAARQNDAEYSSWRWPTYKAG